MVYLGMAWHGMGGAGPGVQVAPRKELVPFVVEAGLPARLIRCR